MQDLDRFEQSGTFVAGQIDLGAVTGDDALGVVAQTGQEHEHLLGGGVLRLVEDDKGMVQGASAHVGQRGDFDDAAVHELLDLIRLQHVIKRVVERPQVRQDLFFQCSGQKAECFAGLHGGAGQDDAADLFLLQRSHGHGHGEVSFARPGRADAEDDVVFADGADVIALAGRLGNDRRLAQRADNAFGREFGDAGVGHTVFGGLQGEAEFLLADGGSAAAGLVELGENFGRAVGIVFFPVDADPSFAGGDLHAEALFHLAQQTLVVLVKRGGRPGIVEMERGALHQALISAETRRPAPIRCAPRERKGFRRSRNKFRSNAA